MQQTTLLSGILLALLVAGCSDDAPRGETTSSTADARPEQVAAGGNSTPAEPPTAAARYCSGDPGQAPAGELTPTRIEAANGNAKGLYEGPVWMGDALYFSSFTFTEGFPSQVMKLQNGELSVALADSGSNGLAVDSAGALIAGTHKYKSVSRYDLDSGNRETVVQEYNDEVFNSPNDLTLTGSDVLYFTDPDYQRSAAPGGQDATRVYRVENGQITVVDDTIANPNGVSLSPDESVLYVAGGGEEGFLRAYDMVDGKPGEGRDIASLTIPDGMAIDCLGNIYASEHANKLIKVFAPNGEQIAHIPLDARVTNAAFGGPEGKTLYITGAGAVWSLELEVAGLPY